MNIDEVRAKLRRLEDTVCLSLFERSQFKLDQKVYTKGAIQIPDFSGSFFEYMFTGTEKLHESAGRYQNPEERPFFITAKDPAIQRKHKDYGTKKVVNVNDKILTAYLDYLPRLCENGDDDEYGSATVIDINCLQALSRRVHIGEQVAQIKYEEKKVEYDKLIAASDIEGISRTLRVISVEQENLKRIREKAIRYNVPADVVSDFFEKVLMPMTIDVEVAYFMSKK